MFCTNCGTEVTEGSKFCTKCGQKLTVSTETDSEVIIKQDKANFVKKRILMSTFTVPGKLVLTNHELSFYEGTQATIKIPLNSIAEIKSGMLTMFSIVDNCGVKYEFAVFSKKIWIDEITKAMQA